jgi:hypothetical protein
MTFRGEAWPTGSGLRHHAIVPVRVPHARVEEKSNHMTQDEAIRSDIGTPVDYQGQPAVITRVYRYQGVGRDAYRVSYHVRTADGTEYHHLDSRLLTSLS